VITHDLRGRWIEKLVKEFPGAKVITLLPNNADLEIRIKERKQRDRSAYGNIEEAIKCNDDLRKRQLYPNETRIDTSNLTPEQTVEEALKVI
jgi:hypothetical protein